MFKFWDVGIIVSQHILDRYEKEMLLLDTIGNQKKLVIVFKKILAIV